jgi:hypothetical protein
MRPLKRDPYGPNGQFFKTLKCYYFFNCLPSKVFYSNFMPEQTKNGKKLFSTISDTYEMRIRKFFMKGKKSINETGG